jgi:hypothetical protein
MLELEIRCDRIVTIFVTVVGSWMRMITVRTIECQIIKAEVRDRKKVKLPSD